MIFHDNRLSEDNSHKIVCPIGYFEKKTATFEIVVSCKLKEALYGLNANVQVESIVLGKLSL